MTDRENIDLNFLINDHALWCTQLHECLNIYRLYTPSREFSFHTDPANSVEFEKPMENIVSAKDTPVAL